MRFTQLSAVGLATAVSVGAVAGGARADLAYDALSTNPGDRWLGFGGTEIAEDTRLDAAAGLVITGATLRMWNNSFTNEVNGTVRFSVYQTEAGRPGALVVTAVVPLVMATNSLVDLNIDLPDTLAPSPDLWTTYRFESFTQPLNYPIVPYNGVPAVGETGPGYAFRAVGVPGWTLSGGTNGFAWEIQTVPGPACLWLGAAALLVARRRGAGRAG